MNSKWQASKIGFVNFWYYDEQEFPFANGRMLLRGANGSGKSVTMQSAIPLLLDGNMSPERLDPFGSRDRKMASYLLEEDDERDERTGYIYMEFKRKESDVWLTIGIGLRARRGKPLERWYFSLNDGRRIGKTFFLYKAMDEKIPLSKKELENRIADGGCVIERQSEYEAYVNQQIFGFDTEEAYREMLDLLIQLRTPKLSKDFKPSVVGGILSDSLQPLSDDDLRPMAEAIENMDTKAMNLKSLKEAVAAAEKVQQGLDRYNRFMLYEKAARCSEQSAQQQSLDMEAQKMRETQAKYETEITRLLQEQQQLDAEKAAMEKLRDSLGKSDALSLKNREQDLLTRISERDQLLASKEEQLADKNQQIVQHETKQREAADKAFGWEYQMEQLLQDMQLEAETMAFEEHGFFADEFTEALAGTFSWQGHETQLTRIEQGIREGLIVLEQAEQYRREADALMQKRDRIVREVDAAQRRENERAALLVQVKNEWKESLFTWSRNNQELFISEEALQKMAAFAEDDDETADFTRVRNIAADHWLTCKDALNDALRKRRNALQELEAANAQLSEELSAWQTQREPEPMRSEAVQKNRAELQAQNIPYEVFYKLVDFKPTLSNEECDYLEEALLDMGILDALVVDENHREKVLAADPGCADRYLFVQPGQRKESLLAQLDLDGSVQDLFAYQRISGILGGISWETREETPQTAVYADGSYQIGAVSGKISGEHRASFIGAQARERVRQDEIARCLAALAENEAAIAQEKTALAELEKRLRILQQEYEALPGDNDLQEAWRLLAESHREVLRGQEAQNAVEQEWREVSETLRGLDAQAAEIASKIYLAPRYAVFQKAAQAADSYRRCFERLKNIHEMYLQNQTYRSELAELVAQLEDEQEQIRYESGQIERARFREQTELRTVREQLALTDYDKIRKELDHCLRWLAGYPAALRCAVETRARMESEQQALILRREKNDEARAVCEKRSAQLAHCYEAELGLGYVVLPEDVGTTAEKVEAYLAAECQAENKEHLLQNLLERFSTNRDRLVEYQPAIIRDLFDELDTPGLPSAARMDIRARYHGERVAFGQLLVHLKEEVDNLEKLIRDADQELFEDILTNTISRKIRGKINSAGFWVEKMNALMDTMDTSSGLKFHLRWHKRSAEVEDQLDTRELVDLLKKDYSVMREEEAEKLSRHFRSKVDEARRRARDNGGTISFYQVMKDTLDYRQWFEFQLLVQKNGERQRELTNSIFGTFSGGEKAMAMYVPLFSAVVAKYDGARQDAPRLLSLDEAFAGVDNRNIRDMFRLMSELGFDFIINSQVLWGDYDTLDAIAVHQLLRPQNAKFVSVMSSVWNGKKRTLYDDESALEDACDVIGRKGN